MGHKRTVSALPTTFGMAPYGDAVHITPVTRSKSRVLATSGRVPSREPDGKRCSD